MPKLVKEPNPVYGNSQKVNGTTEKIQDLQVVNTFFQKKLSHLRFADDIVLVSHEPKELQTMLKELNSESKAVALEINLKKTLVVFNEQIDGEPEIKIEQTPLKIMNS